MRHITTIKLENIRCYANARLDLHDLNVFAGVNNAGKSALLNAIRRLVSVNIDRHPIIGSEGGLGVLGSTCYMTVEPSDVRDTGGIVGLTISLSEQSRSEVERHLGHAIRPDLPLDFQWDQSSGDGHSFFNAGTMVVEYLPIVVIPERRDFIDRPRFSQPTREGIREDLFDANALQANLLRWHFEQPQKLEVMLRLAGNILDAEVTVRFRPSTEHVLLGLGQDTPRSLDSLGCGVVSVLVFAMALASYEKGLLLFEEPELHLHPSIQRRLMDELWRRCQDGAWQALVTTHSNHVLDFEEKSGVRTFLVRRLDTDQSLIEPLNLAHGDKAMLRATLDALGVHPSSLCVANVIIWVEGPSDAAYLRFFLGKCNRALREHVDFSFAFFGGALLAHTELSDDDRDRALVNLASLHPRGYVILDSDRGSETADLGKSYARRFIATVKGSDRLHDRFWVTAGREIENYLRDEVLVWAAGSGVDLQKLTNNERAYLEFGQQLKQLTAQPEHPFPGKGKHAFAQKAVEYMESHCNIDWLDRLDLKAKIAQLVSFMGREEAGSRQDREAEATAFLTPEVQE